jgi:hypothetical protein
MSSTGRPRRDALDAAHADRRMARSAEGGNDGPVDHRRDRGGGRIRDRLHGSDTIRGERRAAVEVVRDGNDEDRRRAELLLAQVRQLPTFAVARLEGATDFEPWALALLHRREHEDLLVDDPVSRPWFMVPRPDPVAQVEAEPTRFVTSDDHVTSPSGRASGAVGALAWERACFRWNGEAFVPAETLSVPLRW